MWVILNYFLSTDWGRFIFQFDIFNCLCFLLQASILGPILFNIFLRDLFLDQENNYFSNYATPSVTGDNTTDVLSSLSKITQELFTWFANKQMKANHDKCHLLLSSAEDIQIANVAIKNSTYKKLLGVTTDNKLKLDKHVENICQRASQQEIKCSCKTSKLHRFT